MRLQRTIQESVRCEGVGLHTGKQVTMLLKPAPVDAGITFVRTDLGGRAIQAVAGNTAATGYATMLRQNGAHVQTVEHMLAALAGLSIDNVTIELDAEEAPIMDGSARAFVRLIAEAGIQTQEKLRPMLKIVKPLFVREGNKQLAIWPSDTRSISYFIDFNHPMLREQSLHYQVSEENFLREVADARTFGFLSDAQAMRANGLARGASLDNAIVLDKETVINKEGLRYQDEFVRHKVLDIIGDLSLAGMPIIGHIVAHKSGHGLNAAMVGKLLQSPQNWVVLGEQETEAAGRPQEQRYHEAAALL